ncbi:class I SAM-dependent methyltransferase [Bailinhaonella thermotolerans]|uniref:Class I SAM-dependent methyltransferase n=1 Tax=Bailinhaonella thermotolerans TaxID=1070861 RepID=A0A3A4B1V7_9ACTN|nr:class I SAM-dependent methyltransferase [Bailinhaonella thermotolerans]RJL35715.1 class I SAM-dependent methyltransferase [Bailinhaonella thermotolerans]
MIYEHPLAYVLGLEGIALMRAYTGEHDRAFVEARLAEIRRFLDDDSLSGAAVEVTRVDSVDGYRIWSRTYDRPNAAFDADEPFIREIVEALPVGDALDAACGTGRISACLAGLGHRVRGVDSSPDMLEHARRRLPEAEFQVGELAALPVPDEAVDLVVCSLALTHVPALDPVLAEFARVLRPGGHLVIADIHPEGVARGSIPSIRLADGRPGRVASHRHLVGDYLRAALAAGLRVRRCEEPRHPQGEPGERTGELAPWDVWPWALYGLAPEAAQAAVAGTPAMLFWHFQR